MWKLTVMIGSELQIKTDLLFSNINGPREKQTYYITPLIVANHYQGD